MANAQQAYRLDTFPMYEPGRARSSQSDMRVVRGGANAQPSVNILVEIAKMAAIVPVVVAALCFARIALTNATVSTMIESDALSAQISEARSTGTSLEMEQSTLSNTAAINSAAKRLGMTAPYEVGTIALSPDVVATDANGSLSLSGTVKNVVGTQE